LNLLPQRLVDNRRVFSRIGLFLVCDLAVVETILEEQIKRPAGEFLAAIFGAIGPQPH
jgi:hypothetical protein